MPDFVHLHVHTEYSLLDGAARIRELVSAAAEKGMTAMAITDHGSMFGVVDFYKAAHKAGIKPILGCEIYVAPRSMEDREPGLDDANYHLVLLAQNDQGYRNLLHIVSEAYTRGFYYKPRTDKETLAKNSEGLIAFSACLGGEIPSAVINRQYERAREAAREYDGIFGRGKFFLELQDHGLAEQGNVNRELVKISRETGIPLVATNDVHYVKKGDAEVQNVLLCIGTGKTVEDEDRMEFGTEEFYLKDVGEMNTVLGEYPEALANTVEIAERCNVSLDFDKTYLPDYQIPEGYTTESYLRKLCLEGLERRYPNAAKWIRDRLDYELRVINDMGFPGYFLIVWDFVRFARDSGVLVGPGRGSAAGSLVAYVLGITNVDPLKYDLLFERFLNPERVSMPDIDIDFCYEKREQVIRYVIEHYGADRVAQIITFGTMAARAAIRDVGRALNMPYADVDRVAKMVPAELGITLDKALETGSELRQSYEIDPAVQKLVDMARAIEGMPRHASTHAAGVVIGKDPLTTYLPLYKSTDGLVATQFPKDTVEEIGLLKMDLLGLRTLTVIGDALNIIKHTTGKEPDIDSIPLDDSMTFEMLGRGDSVGVFQLESSGMRAILRELRPEVFEDIIALVALYRPGPLGSGMVEDFIRRKHGQSPITYLHPLLEPILRETYGVILYQEQVMRIASDLAGFTMGEADLLRRAMGKKKPEVIAGLRSQFVDGAVGRGVDPGIAGQIFDLMEYFAGYGFNKSHSTAYALVSYQTAYLKANFPLAFMAALLTSVMDSADKVALYIDESRGAGIEVLPPCINESLVNFTVVGDKIRFGLAAVKNVGVGAIETIIEARKKDGPFKSFQDFCDRVDHRHVSKRVLESLIKCGALDSLGVNRAQLVAAMDSCVNAAQKRQRDLENGQISLFDLGGSDTPLDQGEAPLPDVPEYPVKELLAMEKEVLGLYISGHPLKEYEDLLKEKVSHTSDSLTGLKDDTAVIVGGMVAGLRKITTRKGEPMVFMMLEDLAGSVEVIVFPRVYRENISLIKPDTALLVRGRVNYNSRDEETKVIAENIQSIDNPGASGDYDRSSDSGVFSVLYIKVPENNGEECLRQIQGILRRHSGTSPVCLFFEATRKGIRTKRDWWVDLGSPVIEELNALLGDNSTYIKYE
ncbi:MAG: DNA polymerase III subunit alpha [Firmicutes bacterium HGW-Firmicutes-14]|nr:MAG: DNA polymerase III subunit alpha [Firmicutes bacterium HGW-Firmicutes-14]